MKYQFLPKFKIVEINNMASLRMGHVIAQNKAAANIACVSFDDNAGNAVKFLENGIIVGLGKDGLIANYKPEEHAQPMLVFTEELIEGPLYSLDQYAEVIGVDGVYPRCLPLYLGDTFTTDNVKVVEDGLYGIEAGSGLICKAGQEAQAMFRGVACKLPAGQNAVELQVINVNAALVPVAEEEEEDGE
jgi:hypothetical protein